MLYTDNARFRHIWVANWAMAMAFLGTCLCRYFRSGPHFREALGMFYAASTPAQRRRFNRRVRLAKWGTLGGAVAFGFMGGVALIVPMVLSGAAADNWSVWFSPLAKAADFGVGMLLAVVAATGVRLASAPRSAPASGRFHARRCAACVARSRRSASSPSWPRSRSSFASDMAIVVAVVRREYRYFVSD